MKLKVLNELAIGVNVAALIVVKEVSLKVAEAILVAPVKSVLPKAVKPLVLNMSSEMDRPKKELAGIAVKR